MIRSGSRAGWAIVIPALLLGTWVVGSSMLARRARIRIGGLLSGQHGSPVVGRGETTGEKNELSAIVERMDDARLSSLRTAAESWRTSLAPRRLVVDQVCLVSDLPSFLDAIAAWDERHYFPILIDEPAWTLPFLRSFQPARVVRYSGSARAAGSTFDARRPGGPVRGDAAWSRAIEAVRRACSTPPDAGGANGSEREARPAPHRVRLGWFWPILTARRSGPRWRWRRGTSSRSCASGLFTCHPVFGGLQRAPGDWVTS